MSKTRGHIAAGHSATAEAAATILQEGGNAFDAAIAALLASFVAEPCMSSAGGGAFLTAYRPDGVSFCYDCFVQTPRNKRPVDEIEFFPIEIDFGTAKEVFHIGMGSVAVPGTIAGIFKIHEDLGSMPMREIAEPAIQLAKEGVVIDAFQDHDFHLLKDILAVCKPSPVFWNGDHLISTGETMYMPEFADCLDFIVREGQDEFYKGDIAKLILKMNDERGGHLTAEDLAAYTVPRRQPLRVPYKDRSLLTNPLPSLGGSLIALALQAFASQGPVDFPIGSTEEVARFAKVLSALDRLEKTPRNIAAALQRAFPNLPIPLQQPNDAKLGGTSHFSILDEHGNAVSVTTSNGEGCGHFVPGTGIILNNMLGESALLPNGLHSWAPNTRLGSMMSPSILLDAHNQVEMVLGSGGAGRIPFMLAQAIYKVVDQGADIHEAVNSSRMHIIDGICNLEPGLPADAPMPAEVREVVAWEKQSLYFGGVHAVMRNGMDIDGQGDERRGGVDRQS